MTGLALATPMPRLSTRVVAGERTTVRTARSAAVFGYVFAAFAASSALGYALAYKNPASRAALARSFGSDAGLSAIIGKARALETVAGFTAWRSLGVVSVVGAVWAVFAATRATRGEEDAARWELLLAGAVTRRQAAAQAVAGLYLGLAPMFVIPALALVLVGRLHDSAMAAPGCLFLALAFLAAPLAFVGVGALAAQLAPTRRRANGYGAIVVAVSYAMRMIADAGSGASWLRWCSPLGWVEETHPLTGSALAPFVPLVALGLACAGAAVVAAGRRDLGAGLIADHDRAPTHTRLLAGPLLLAVRLERSFAFGWAVALVAGPFVLGTVARTAATASKDSNSFTQILERLGGHGGAAAAFIGVSFIIVTTLVSVVAAAQVVALREEEADGLAEHLLVRPVSRARHVWSRVAVAGGIIVAGSLLAGLAALAGQATQHTGISPLRMIEAGINTAPPALALLGIGVLVVGVRPRLTAAACYGLLSWSLLVELVGGSINANHWLLDTSLLHQVSPAPAVAPNWVSAGGLCLVGLAATVAGVLAFTRRDVQPA